MSDTRTPQKPTAHASRNTRARVPKMRQDLPWRMLSKKGLTAFHTDMRRHEAKSLYLIRAILDKIARVPDPRVPIAAALTWARDFSAQRPNDVWLARWIPLLERTLDGGDADLKRLCEVMLDPSERGIDMRQSSPWAGVLTVRERTNALLEFEQQWKHDHG